MPGVLHSGENQVSQGFVTDAGVPPSEGLQYVALSELSSPSFVIEMGCEIRSNLCLTRGQGRFAQVGRR